VTIEVYKVTPTIASRCQHFEFRPIDKEIVVKKRSHADSLALQAIARIADDGMRDAQFILGQLISFSSNHIREADVIQNYAFAYLQVVAEMLGMVAFRESYRIWLKPCKKMNTSG
jgi:DNA polymerase-3 subunit gamma/tau